MTIKIALASTSEIKVGAANQALEVLNLRGGVELKAFKASSGVNEQPFEQETREGANNRAEDGFRNVPDAVASLAIENGIFEERDKDRKNIYVDRGVVTLKIKNGDEVETYTAVSKGVFFPDEVVEATRKKEGGFKEHTVGKTLAEMGLVKLHNDPHADLPCIETGKKTPREDLLAEAVLDVMQQAKLSERISGAKIDTMPVIEEYVEKPDNKVISK